MHIVGRCVQCAHSVLHNHLCTLSYSILSNATYVSDDVYFFGFYCTKVFAYFIHSELFGWICAKQRQKHDQIHINTVECLAQHALLMSCVEKKRKKALDVKHKTKVLNDIHIFVDSLVFFLSEFLW